VRYRIAKDDETAVRSRLEELSAAWNAGDKRALEDLAVRNDEFPGWELPQQGFLGTRIKSSIGGDKCRIQLDDDVSFFRFFGRGLTLVRESFSCLPLQGAGPAKAMPRPLELAVAKGPRGWRFASIGQIRFVREVPEPRRLKEVRSEYPAAAQQARVQGIVTLLCQVFGAGKVVEADVLRGIPLMDAAAVRAISQWEFEPTVVDGAPVPIAVFVQFDFRLDPARVDHHVLLLK
jgi:TonB family protein